MAYPPALSKVMDKVKTTPRVCKECGGSFLPTGPSQSYCNEDCLKAARAKRLGIAPPKPMKDVETTTCKQCGDPFDSGHRLPNLNS